MSDHFLRDEKGQVHTILSMANIYSYKGFIFEFHPYCGPSKLKKDWSDAKCMGRTFFKALSEWQKLTDKEKLATRISG